MDEELKEMSLTEYAKSRGISVQSVSQSFNRHRKALIDMYHTQGKAIILSPEAVRYLDRTRQKEPPAVVKQDTMQGLRDQVEQLRLQREDDAAEIQHLNERIRELENRIDQKDQIIQNQAQQMLIQSQQMLLLTTKAKKGVFQRMREFFMGTDGVPLPGDGNDKIIDE